MPVVASAGRGNEPPTRQAVALLVRDRARRRLRRLNTAITIALLIVLTFTGLLLWLGEQNTTFRFTGTVDVHDIATILIVLLVSGHLYLAIFNPSTRASLSGMTNGSVDREWARANHRRWVEECEAQEPDDRS